MTPMDRTVEALAVAAVCAAEWHKDCAPRRMVRAAQWERRRDAYDRAASVERGAVAERAQALAIAANRRALAWAALARMDAAAAAAHLVQAHKGRAMCPTLTAGVWRA